MYIWLTYLTGALYLQQNGSMMGKSPDPIPILPRFLVKSLAHETTPIQSLFSIIIAELVWLILWPHGQLGCGSYSASQHFHHL